MKARIYCLLLVVAAALAGPPAAAANSKIRNVPGAVPERYVVVLNDTEIPATGRGAFVARAAAAAERSGARVDWRYEHAFRGFLMRAPEHVAARIAELPEVAYIEPDTLMTLSATQWNPGWGLDRIDQRAQPLDLRYDYSTTGAGVNVYVVDSGILFSHPDLAHQVPRGVDIQDRLHEDGPDWADWWEDCAGSFGPGLTGHGTAVASIVAGKYHGVAKDAILHSVKVMDCRTGTIHSGMSAAGIDWVIGNHTKPAVVNLSVNPKEGQSLEYLRTALQNLSKAGVTAAWSAGNREEMTTAGAAETIVVGATAPSDRRLSGTCWGADIYAPGWEVPAASTSGGTGKFSYTSAATPYVAGAAARYLQTNPSAAPGTVRYSLMSSASRIVTGVPYGVSTRLLYMSP